MLITNALGIFPPASEKIRRWATGMGEALKYLASVPDTNYIVNVGRQHGLRSQKSSNVLGKRRGGRSRICFQFVVTTLIWFRCWHPNELEDDELASNTL